MIKWSIFRRSSTHADGDRLAIGARGIEWMKKDLNAVFPLYDEYGNMVSNLSRNGGSYAPGDRRACDAWGNIRSADNSGDPKERRCANLGHKQDDESGLVYMRARYYDGTGGRVISEDPDQQGPNWYCYLSGDSINELDLDGRYKIDPGNASLFITMEGLFYSSICAAILCCAKFNYAGASAFIGVAIAFGALALGATDASLATQFILQAPALLAIIVPAVVAAFNATQVTLDVIALACLDTGQ